LGIAASVALFDSAGLTLVSVPIAVSVPLVNVLDVIVLVQYSSMNGDIPNWSQTISLVTSNPLIIACTMGVLLNVTEIGLSPLIGLFLGISAHAAMPLGLLAVGAGLDFKAMRQAGFAVGLTTATKLIALPLNNLPGLSNDGH
jgi:predicted permease